MYSLTWEWMLKNATCAYCPREIDITTGEGDHIIPERFGEFRELKRFRYICVECNSQIGKSEQQLLRSGFESDICRIAEPSSRRRSGRGMSRVAALDASPPQLMLESGGAQFMIDLSQSEGWLPAIVDQIRIEFKNEISEEVRLFNGMEVKHIAERLEKFKSQSVKSVRIHASSEMYAKAKDAVLLIWPESDHQELDPIDTSKGHWLRSSVRVTSRYFRALAKIAFHYYVVYSRQAHAAGSPKFSPIRRFILEGGDPEQFYVNDRHKRVRFEVPTSVAYEACSTRSAWWSHMLWADTSSGRLLVGLQLFYGRGCIPILHQFDFGATTDETMTFAHLLTWKQGSSKIGVAEQMPVRSTIPKSGPSLVC